MREQHLRASWAMLAFCVGCVSSGAPSASDADGGDALQPMEIDDVDGRSWTALDGAPGPDPFANLDGGSSTLEAVVNGVGTRLVYSAGPNRSLKTSVFAVAGMRETLASDEIDAIGTTTPMCD